MSPAISRPEEAIGVECAWPVREVDPGERQDVQAAAVRSHSYRRTAVMLVVAVSLLAAGGWSLTDPAVKIGTAASTSMPTQTK